MTVETGSGGGGAITLGGGELRAWNAIGFGTSTKEK